MKFFLFLISFFHHHLLVSSSRPSSSSLVAFNSQTDFLQFKDYLAEALEYDYEASERALLADLEILETDDMILRTMQKLKTEAQAHVTFDSKDNVWMQALSALAYTNDYFSCTLRKDSNRKAVLFLKYILDSFGIPNDLHYGDDLRVCESEIVLWAQLRKLYLENLGVILTVTSTNIYGIVVYLYIRMMDGNFNFPTTRYANSNTTERVRRDFEHSNSLHIDFNSSHVAPFDNSQETRKSQAPLINKVPCRIRLYHSKPRQNQSLLIFSVPTKFTILSCPKSVSLPRVQTSK